METDLSNFVAFILSHGRPDNIITLNSLKKHGYTGKIIIVVDDEDEKKDEYLEKYGDMVVVFNKKEMADKTDEGDNFNNRRTTTHCRNFTFEYAKEKGYKYFIQLDDDYHQFGYKFTSDLKYQHNNIKNLDNVFKAMVNFMKKTNTKSIAMAQGGDFIGGESGSFAQELTLRRKCMNTFVCSMERPFKFFGRLNEDVNTYMTLGSKGDLFFTFVLCYIIPSQTQKQKGGMTEAYLDSGTYIKSFYTVMYNPSFCKIGLMGEAHKRLHHKIKWSNAVPMILNERYKKR